MGNLEIDAAGSRWHALGRASASRVTACISDLFMSSPEAPASIAHTSRRRFGTPEDYAKVVEFLVTDLSDFGTGACIDVTGGTIDKLAFQEPAASAGIRRVQPGSAEFSRNPSGSAGIRRVQPGSVGIRRDRYGGECD